MSEYIKSTIRLDKRLIASEIESRLMLAIKSNEDISVESGDHPSIPVPPIEYINYAELDDLSNIIMDVVEGFVEELDCKVLK